jgi:hypothetical protein
MDKHIETQAVAALVPTVACRISNSHLRWGFFHREASADSSILLHLVNCFAFYLRPCEQFWRLGFYKPNSCKWAKRLPCHAVPSPHHLLKSYAMQKRRKWKLSVHRISRCTPRFRCSLFTVHEVRGARRLQCHSHIRAMLLLPGLPPSRG